MITTATVTIHLKKWLAFVPVLMLIGELSASERHLKFDHLGLKDGLSQSSINDIFQDSKGYMWFGTQDGLNKFDGHDFTVYKHEPFNLQSLGDSFTVRIAEQNDGNLWIFSSRNISLFDRKTETFTRFTNPNGSNDPHLPHFGYVDMFRDSLGQIWFMGQIGMDRYDPETGIFHPYSGKFFGDENIRFRCMYEDSKGRIWVGTVAAGLFLLDWQNGKAIRQAGPDDPHGISSLLITSGVRGFGSGVLIRNQAIIEDDMGNLWMLTRDGNLNRFNPETGHFKTFSTGRTFLPIGAPPVNAKLMDSNGYIWIAWNDQVVVKFDCASGSYKTFRNDPNDPYSISPGPITSMLEDRGGTLWLASNGGGVCRYDSRTDRFLRSVNDPSNPTSISTNFISRMFEDRSGTIWFGGIATSLIKYSREKQKFRHYLQNLSDPKTLSSNMVWSLAEDQEGHIWVGTNNDGLVKLDHDRETVLAQYTRNAQNPDPLLSPLVRGVYVDPAGMVWFGANATNTASFIKLNPKTGAYKAIRGLNNLLFVTPSVVNPDDLLIAGVGGVFRVNWKTDRVTQIVPDLFQNFGYRGVAEAADGTLWLAAGGGLFRHSPKDDQTKAFQYNPQDPTSISNQNIMAVLIDRQETLWVGTMGGGLNRYLPDSQSFRHFSINEGMPNEVVYQILEDEDGYLWLSTNHGLARFNPQNYSFRNYDTQDGLQSDEFNQGAFLRTRSGEMMFGGINGFNAFFPKELINNGSAPQISVSATKNVDVTLGKELQNNDRVVLNPDDNVVEFSFVALDFAEPEKNKYGWRLDGFHQDWVLSDQRRRATFTNLAAGEYSFRVKAANSDGIWSDHETVLSLTVLPHFYETWWFRLITVLAGLMMVFAVFVRQRNRLHRRQEETLLARENLRKSEELEYARQIQLAMLPKKNLPLENLEVMGHMITASEVGGDYFDFFHLDERRLCIAYGDATGHGVAAGLVVGMVKMASTVWALHPKGLTEMMQDLNVGLRKSLPVKSMGMAFGLAVIDLVDHTVEVCSSGMPFPFHYSAETGRLRSLVIKGPPLGFLKKIKPTSQRFQLHKGDQLVFLSDGFVERFNEKRQIWGSRALVKSLDKICPTAECAQQIADDLIKDCDRFAGTRPNEDDMTIVVVRVKAHAPALARVKQHDMAGVEANST